MKCLNCGKEFESRHPSQKFCTRKGRMNCKDGYHNTKNPERMERLAVLNRYPGGAEKDRDDIDDGFDDPGDDMYYSNKDWG